jgi:hypothetical protein
MSRHTARSLLSLRDLHARFLELPYRKVVAWGTDHGFGWWNWRDFGLTRVITAHACIYIFIFLSIFLSSYFALCFRLHAIR